MESRILKHAGHRSSRSHDLKIARAAIFQSLARASNELKLPHPIHIHCNQLGRVGNWSTTLETMKLLDGLQAHLTHIQFHSYLGSDPKSGSGEAIPFGSAVEKLVEQFNNQKTLSVDVRQVMFGPTISMTGDSAATRIFRASQTVSGTITIWNASVAAV